MAKADTTLENILLVAGISAVVVVGGTIIIAAVSYSVITSLFSSLKKYYNTGSDNMGILDYFRRKKSAVDDLKQRVQATQEEISNVRRDVSEIRQNLETLLPVVYREDKRQESETMAAEKTETTMPARLEATVQDLERVKETLLARYKEMPRGEETADTAFVQAEALRLYAERLLTAHYDLVADNMLGALQGHQGKATQQAQGMEAALQKKDVAGYIKGASGLVGSICEGVSKATKFQCAVNRDHEGYKAEVADNIAQVLDGVRQKYLAAK